MTRASAEQLVQRLKSAGGKLLCDEDVYRDPLRVGEGQEVHGLLAFTYHAQTTRTLTSERVRRHTKLGRRVC